jgi:hypothetical protein
MFTSGLDLVDAQANLTGEGEDAARKAIRFHKLILKWQEYFSVLEDV